MIYLLFAASWEYAINLYAFEGVAAALRCLVVCKSVPAMVDIWIFFDKCLMSFVT